MKLFESFFRYVCILTFSTICVLFPNPLNSDRSYSNHSLESIINKSLAIIVGTIIEMDEEAFDPDVGPCPFTETKDISWIYVNRSER